MPHKQVLFHSAAREKVLRGASLLADAVRVTLGPKIQIGAYPEELGRTHRLQRRRHHRQGIRPQGPRGKSRRTGAPPGAKVVRTALENAVSVAGVLLLTEATMTEITEPKRERLTEPEMTM